MGVGIEVVTELQHSKVVEVEFTKSQSAFRPCPIIADEPKNESLKSVPQQSSGEKVNVPVKESPWVCFKVKYIRVERP